MERASSTKAKVRKGIVLKTLERCRTLRRQRRSISPSSRSSPRSGSCKQRVSPQGYFTVCVGTMKERFLVRTEFCSHPFFQKLLGDAESEFEFSTEGPLELPCDVDVFRQALQMMEQEVEDGRRKGRSTAPQITRFARARSGYQTLRLSRQTSRG